MSCGLALTLVLASALAPREARSPPPSWSSPPGRAPRVETPPSNSLTGLTVRLDAGAFLGAGWATDTYRNDLGQLQLAGYTFLGRGTEPDPGLLARTLPVAGPLLALEYGGPLARSEWVELLLTSVLQSVGLAVLSYRMIFEDEEPSRFELSFSPLVAGRLGVGTSLTF